MFEKRLHAFRYAVGITFLFIALLNVINFIVYSLMSCGTLYFWPFTAIAAGDMIEYMLNIKLMGVIFGAIFLVCYFWEKKLDKMH